MYLSVGGSEKRLGFVFTCMTTRAVLLETVLSMDVKFCFEMRIEMFNDHRGSPSVIWSVNGANFVGAKEELMKCIQTWKHQSPSRLSDKRIKWKKQSTQCATLWCLMGASGKILQACILFDIWNPQTNGRITRYNFLLGRAFFKCAITDSNKRWSG